MNGPCFQYLEQYSLVVPLWKKPKFRYTSEILMSLHRIPLNLYKSTEKYIKVYLLQPSSTQEDLWGLSLQLQGKPHKTIIYLITQTKGSYGKRALLLVKKKLYVFMFPFPWCKLKEKHNVLQPKEITYDFQISTKCNTVIH